MKRSWTSWPRRLLARARRRAPERLLSIELVSACNLRCAYCFRDEEMLYRSLRYLSPERLRAILDRTARAWPRFALAFTGGEPSLHPRFADVVREVARRGLGYRLVTNGWHFERIRDALVRTRRALQYVVFSLDGAGREEHDRHRGAGSFDRLQRAMAWARSAELPFQVNVVLRKGTRPQMEALSLLAARAGARAVNFGALLPTSPELHREHALAESEELLARAEAAALSRVLRIPVRLALGLHDATPGAHCYPLRGLSANVDYEGRLTLCGNLSSFRSGAGTRDVVADAGAAQREAFVALRALARETLAVRDTALGACRESGTRPGPILGSPCLSCLDHFDKLAPGLRRALASGPAQGSRAS